MFSEIGYYWEVFDKRSAHLKKAEEYYKKCLNHMCEHPITGTYHWYDRAVNFLSRCQVKEKEMYQESEEAMFSHKG